MEMNLLSALAPTSVPVEPVEGMPGRVAVAAAIKVEHEMAHEVVRLLAPSVGRHVNRSA